jgi:dolichol kinase
MSSVVPFSYLFIPREVEIIFLSVFFVTMLTIDLARAKSLSFRSLYDRFLGHILRHHEKEEGGFGFTGGTYIVLAFLLCVIFFPKPIAITAMFVVIFADSMAAIVGMHMGKKVITKGKSLEGSLAFFATGIAIVLLSPKMTSSSYEYLVGVIAVFLTTLVELFPVKIDDNIVIPMFFGTVYFLLINFFIH